MVMAITLVEYIQRKIAALKGVKTQRQIAREAGLPQSNLLTMFKTGDTKVALWRIPALAKALEADPVLMFRLALEEQRDSELQRVLVEIYAHAVSAEEAAVVEFIRSKSPEGA